jgi:hypothetical protein
MITEEIIAEFIAADRDLSYEALLEPLTSVLEQANNQLNAGSTDITLMNPSQHHLVKDGRIKTGKLSDLNLSFENCSDSLLEDIGVWLNYCNIESLTEASTEHYVRRYFTSDNYKKALKDGVSYDLLFSGLMNICEQLDEQIQLQRLSASKDSKKSVRTNHIIPPKYFDIPNDTSQTMSMLHEAEQVADGFGDYSAMKEFLFLRAVNYRRNRKSLETQHCIYQRFGDIAVTMYLLSAEHSDAMMSVKVGESIYKQWGKSTEELWNRAMSNTVALYPPRLYTLEQVMTNKDNDLCNFMDPMINFSLPQTAYQSYTLTDSRRANGATVLFYPGVCARLVQLLGDDFYAIPHNIADAVIHTVSTISAKDVRKTAANELKNPYNPPETALSGLAFRYYSAVDRLSALQPN